MRFLRRRQIESYNPVVAATTVEKELYQGYDIQFLFLDTNGSTGPSGTLEFSIEINGIQVYNGSLLELNAENALRYGFNSVDFATGQNLFVGLLELKPSAANGNVSHQYIKSIKIKTTSGNVDALDITVGEIIDIT